VECRTHALVFLPDVILAVLDRLEEDSCKSVKIIVQHSKVLLFLVAHSVHVHSPEVVKDNKEVHHFEGKSVERHGLLPVGIVLETTIKRLACTLNDRRETYKYHILLLWIEVSCSSFPSHLVKRLI
jgi:hypothetical protein